MRLHKTLKPSIWGNISVKRKIKPDYQVVDGPPIKHALQDLISPVIDTLAESFVVIIVGKKVPVN